MANNDNSIILFGKLRRFYNRIKALIDLLDERIEETEAQITDTVNDVSTLSNDLDTVKEEIYGSTVEVYIKSISYLGGGMYMGYDKNDVAIQLSNYPNLKVGSLIYLSSSFSVSNLTLNPGYYKMTIISISNNCYIFVSGTNIYTSNLTPVIVNTGSIRESTGLTNLFPQLNLSFTTQTGDNWYNKRISSYGDKSIPIKKSETIVFELGEIYPYKFGIWVFDEELNPVAGTVLDDGSGDIDWAKDNNFKYTFISKYDGYVAIYFGKDENEVDETFSDLSEVQALDITLKYAYNNTELTKAQKSNDILLVENAKKNYLKPDFDAGYTLTIYGVTFTINSDYSVSISGSATNDAKFRLMTGFFNLNNAILSGCSDGGWDKYYIHVGTGAGSGIAAASLDGDSEIFNLNSSHNVYIIVRASQTVDITMYPMIRPAGTSSDYVPWCMSNQELTKKQVSDDILFADNAKKNYVKLDHDSGYSETHAGVTLTVNSNGTFTLNGTSTGYYAFTLASNLDTLSNVILNGCYDGSGDGTYNLFVDPINGGSSIALSIDGDSDVFTIPSNYRMGFQMWSGQTFNNKTFYPMIRPAGTTPEWVPYMKSNLELTQNDIARGKRVCLGSKTTGDSGNINLSENLSNFKHVLVLQSYYESGVASYGQLYLPVSVCLDIFTGDIGASLIDINGVCTKVIFHETYIYFERRAAINNGNYWVVYGIR